MNGITPKDSKTIGFVLCSYLSGAVDTAELNRWALHVMNSSDDYPPYLVDLVEFDDTAMHVYRAVGFHPDRQFSQGERRALRGIAMYRGKQVSGASANDMRALEEYPHVLEEFLEVFPFLDPSK